MQIENILDGIYVSVTRRRSLQVFTVFTRILLAAAFTPPSIIKILHKPFTVLPDSNPVGHYFNALYETGFYYEFIGWAQLTAAILLLFPRTAHLGALMFLPIIVNVAVLTTSVGFKGTWVLTILMSLAAAWLVAWEYDRLKPILIYKRRERTRPLAFQFVTMPLFFGAGGIAMAIIWKLIGLGNFSNYFQIGLLLTGLGLAFGIVVALHYRFMRVGELDSVEDGLQ
ncbi:MAG: DoxX family protein [Pyrinomonadaceae bacterium]